MGAVGTRQVINDLRKQGHHPIELERGSTSFKIWKAIKIKRIRVPDILCVNCATRVESRAKRRLELSMSHSFSDPERGWDYGLEDKDFVALVVCYRNGERPIDWETDNLVQYVSVESLRTAYKQGGVYGVHPKGAQEGFEARITWPTSRASAPGVVSTVAPGKLQYRREEDNRTITLQLIRKKDIQLQPLVSEGERIEENQILASTVPVQRSFPCSNTVSKQRYIELLRSSSLSERYTAAKALSQFTSNQVNKALAHRVEDAKDHIYVRLEAAASLARHEDERGESFIQTCLTDQYLENRLEAVIVLGEIGTAAASQLLIETLSEESQHPEIRAGAAWALGEMRDESSINALIESFLNIEEEIRIEAARALAKLTEAYTPKILAEFSASEPSERPGIAWALSKRGRFSVEQLLHTLVDDDARRWVAYILGTQDQQEFLKEVGALRAKDDEVYFAVTVLWQIMNSWVWGLEEHG